MNKEARSAKSRILLLKLASVLMFAILIYSGLEFTNPIKITAGFVFPPSVLPGDTVNTFMDAERSHKRTKIPIVSCGDEYFTFQENVIHAGIKPSYSHSGASMPHTGIPVPADVPSSLYYISDTLPFIVKPDVMPEILLVYPWLTRVAQSSWAGKSFITHPRADTVSLKTPFGKFPHYENFVCRTQSRFPKAGIVTDLDLPGCDLSRVKVLVFFGNAGYTTEKIRLKVEEALNKGINVLIISGFFMEYKVNMPNDSTMVYFDLPERDPEEDYQNKFIRYKYLDESIFNKTGVSYFRGGFSEDGAVLNPIQSFPWNKVPPKLKFPVSAWLGQVHNADSGFFRQRIYATIPAAYTIFSQSGVVAEYQYKSGSGKVMIFGSEAFLDKMDEPGVEDMLFEAINYLNGSE